MLINTFLIPIILLLNIKFYRDEISKLIFCVLLGFCLALQCYIESEIFALVILFGAISLFLFFIFFKDNDKIKLIKQIRYLIFSLLITLALISPLLFFFFMPPELNSSLIPPGLAYVNDLLSPIIPAHIYLLNLKLNSYFLSAIKHNMSGLIDVAEYNSYLGLPIIILLFLYFKSFWDEKLTKFLFLLLLIFFICSLGPILHVYGYPFFELPWKLFAYFPLLKSALPVRFGLFISLIVSIIICLWLTKSNTKSYIKFILVSFCILFLIPSFNYSDNYYASAVLPKFMSEHLYKKYIHQNDVVLILPYGYQGNSMLWQMFSNFYFKMSGGYLGYTPSSFSNNIFVQFLYNYPVNNTQILENKFPNLINETQYFLKQHKVKAIFVYDNQKTWQLFFSNLGMDPIEVGGVDVYLTKNIKIPSVLFHFHFQGWYGLESDSTDYWQWSAGNSSLIIDANSNSSVQINGQIEFISSPRTVNIYINNHLVKKIGQSLAKFNIKLPIQKGKKYVIQFVSLQPSLKINNDPRQLAFSIKNYQIYNR